MKIAAICCTYLRPTQLGHMIRCFEKQDYPDAELIVLDDAGQYAEQEGERWRLISTTIRYPTLGEKRNAAAALASDNVEAFAVWDDDDLYLPWALRTCVAGLDNAQWSRPSLVLHPQQDGTLVQHETGGLFHGGWAYRREAFVQVGGYPSVSMIEDRELMKLFEKASIPTADPLESGVKPFYIYPWDTGDGWHLSGMGAHGYHRLGRVRGAKTSLVVADPPDIDLDNPAILPGIQPRKF